MTIQGTLQDGTEEQAGQKLQGFNSVPDDLQSIQLIDHLLDMVDAVQQMVDILNNVKTIRSVFNTLHP